MQFGTVLERAAVAQLGASDAKVPNTHTSAYVLMHTVTLTPEADELIELTKVECEIAQDAGSDERTITPAYTVQDDGGTESAKTVIGSSLTNPALTNNCTNNVFALREHESGVLHRGKVGRTVTVRYYQRSTVTSVSTTFCMRNARATGRIATAIPIAFAGQFRGCFR